MSRELLASQKNNGGILLDPRTKLAEHFQTQAASENQDIENSTFPFSGC